MQAQKKRVSWKRQTKTVDGYHVEMIRVPSSDGPKRLAADDCPSGDWAGAALCDPGRLRVVLADVEDKGHAVRRYHETLERHLAVLASPTQWLTNLDADWPPGERFASVGVVEVDTERHEFRSTLAGHPDPILWVPGDAARVLPECRLGLVGLNLGVADAEPIARPFPAGACLVLVSDGVLDAGVGTRRETFGMNRLLAAINSASSASKVASRILKAVTEHVGGAAPEDDVTVVAITRTAAAVSLAAREEQRQRRTALFLRVRDGEPHRFAVLVDELGEVFRRRLHFDEQVRALNSNPADVEDVLQQTFLRIWEHRDRFDPSRGVIDAWAWVIARNAALDVLRLRSRTSPNTSLLDAVEDTRATAPDGELVAAETQQAFTEALERVTDPKARRALELRLVAGLPYAAVSKATGVPVGTVAIWVHRLRRSLRAGALRAA